MCTYVRTLYIFIFFLELLFHKAGGGGGGGGGGGIISIYISDIFEIKVFKQ
jgi:hypothetical protein